MTEFQTISIAYHPNNFILHQVAVKHQIKKFNRKHSQQSLSYPEPSLPDLRTGIHKKCVHCHEEPHNMCSLNLEPCETCCIICLFLGLGCAQSCQPVSLARKLRRTSCGPGVRLAWWRASSWPGSATTTMSCCSSPSTSAGRTN